jgi:geranylgeranyl pyrophosphate synthase
MCEGEIGEISCRSNLDTDLNFYLEQVLWNLNADMEGCTKFGAILGGGSEKEVKVLADFGRRVGFILALISDLKDCVDVEGNLISRLKHESVPFPILHCSKSSEESAIQIKSILGKSSITSKDLQKIFLLCFKTRSFKRIKDIVINNAEKIYEDLQSLKPSNAKKILLQMIRNKIFQVTKLYDYAHELQDYFLSENCN